MASHLRELHLYTGENISSLHVDHVLDRYFENFLIFTSENYTQTIARLTLVLVNVETDFV